MNEVTIRKFKSGDIEDLLKIFDTFFDKFAGFVPRTPEIWKYLVLQRPGFSTGDIFVAHQNDRVVGYTVVGFKKMRNAKVATIYELCARNENIITQLLESANTYALENFADYILLQPPNTERTMQKCARSVGFSKISEPATKIMVTLINPPKLLETLAEVFNEKSKTDSGFKELVKNDRKLLIKVDSSYITLQIQDRELKVLPTKEMAKVTLEMTSYNFMQLFLGLTSPLKALIRRKLRIKGMFSSLFALKLVKALQPNLDFYFPLTEHF